jgi:hypothetical protein
MTFAQWNPQADYLAADTVYDGPQAYVAVVDNTGLQPSLNTPATWTLFNPPPTPVVDSLNAITGAVSLVAGTGISVLPAVPTAQDIEIANDGVLSVDGAVGVLTTKVGQYYLTSNQTLTSGSTDIIFTSSQTWSDTTAITWTGPSASFTVAVKGLYQLVFNVLVTANGATYLTTSNKGASIDITRSPSAEQIIILQNGLVATQQNYGQCAVGTVALDVGDVINCRVGTPLVVAHQSQRGGQILTQTQSSLGLS